MIAVKPIDDQEVYRFYGRQVVKPFVGYAARKGLRTVAIGGLIEDSEGRIWGFIDFRLGHRLKAIYRYMRKIIDWAVDHDLPEIWVSRDVSIDTSERLLKRAGFELAEWQIDGFEIWVWRNTKVKKNG